MPLMAVGMLVNAEAYEDGRGKERGAVEIQTSPEVTRKFGCLPSEVPQLKAKMGQNVQLPFTISERQGRDGTRYTFVDLLPLSSNGNGKV